MLLHSQLRSNVLTWQWIILDQISSFQQLVANLNKNQEIFVLLFFSGPLKITFNQRSRIFLIFNVIELMEIVEISTIFWVSFLQFHSTKIVKNKDNIIIWKYFFKCL